MPQDARDAGEDDIEAILAEIISKEKQQTAVSCIIPRAVTAGYSSKTVTLSISRHWFGPWYIPEGVYGGLAYCSLD